MSYSISVGELLDSNNYETISTERRSPLGIPMPEVGEISVDERDDQFVRDYFNKGANQPNDSPKTKLALEPIEKSNSPTLDARGLGEFGESCLDETDIKEAPAPTPIVKPTAETISTLKVENPGEFSASFTPAAVVAPERVRLSIKQTNALAFKAIDDAFEPVEGHLTVIPEVADSIRWLKPNLYRTVMENGRLFVSSGHPSLKLVKALVLYGEQIESIKQPAYSVLLSTVQYAAHLKPSDYQKYDQLIKELGGAIDQLNSPTTFVIKKLFLYGGHFYPEDNLRHSPIAFNRKMLRYELAVHRLLRTIWPLILKQVETQNGRASAEWQTALLAYGDILRSTQSVANDIAKERLLNQLPSVLTQLKHFFHRFNIKEVIREEVLFRLMQIHLNIVRGCDGEDIKEHKMEAAFAFRCLKGGLLNDKEYGNIFDLEGNMSYSYFESLVKKIKMDAKRFNSLQDQVLETYQEVTVEKKPEAIPTNKSTNYWIESCKNEFKLSIDTFINAAFPKLHSR